MPKFQIEAYPLDYPKRSSTTFYCESVTTMGNAVAMSNATNEYSRDKVVGTVLLSLSAHSRVEIRTTPDEPIGEDA